MITVGVLALQGDFHRHCLALSEIGISSLEVRTEHDLSEVDSLIIPGGESTTVGILLSRFGLDEKIKSLANSGMPVWGTCMGMITLAKEIENSQQSTLALMDITVKRNAFGRQIDSFEANVYFKPLDDEVHGVFIRAPYISKWSKDVEVLAKFRDVVVCVRQDNLLATSFHPELTPDRRLHEYFVEITRKAK